LHALPGGLATHELPASRLHPLRSTPADRFAVAALVRNSLLLRGSVVNVSVPVPVDHVFGGAATRRLAAADGGPEGLLLPDEDQRIPQVLCQFWADRLCVVDDYAVVDGAGTHHVTGEDVVNGLLGVEPVPLRDREQEVVIRLVFLQFLELCER